MPQWLVIGISGVTCGGKTTLADNLHAYLRAQRNVRPWKAPYNIGDVHLISQDDYFLPVDDLRHKWNDKLNAINFELITSLDMKQMLSDIKWLMEGRYLAADNMENIEYINEMAMSTNFEHYAPPPPHTHYSNNHHHHQIHQQQMHFHPQSALNPRHIATHAPPPPIMRVNSINKINILVIEGFMIFNEPKLLTLCDMKFHFHLPYEKCYERRVKRTYDPPDVTGYFEICVWPHYEKNFAEFRDRKDITFLNGELSQDRIFKFVLQRIVTHFEERCDVACPPHKLLGIPSCSGGSSMGKASCPMEQQ